MKHKAIIPVILILLTVITSAVLLSLPVAAADTAEITVETNEIAVAGKESTVDIDISDNPGFSSLNLLLSYDQKYLTLVSVELGDRLKDTSVKLTTSGKTTEYPYKISLKSSEDIVISGNLLKVKFKLSKPIPLGTYKVSVSCGNGEMKNSSGSSVSAKTVSGGFLIDCQHNYIVDLVCSPTCSAEGFTQYRCTECARFYHDNFVDKKPHTWKTVSTTKATCTEDGITKKICTVCGEEDYIKNSSALGHSYGTPVFVLSTCVEEGYTLKVCTRCGSEIKDDYQPLADHIYEETYVEEATCQNNGYRTLVCSVCGDKNTEIIPMVDHDYVISEVFEATHEERGYTSYECRFCGITTKDNYTDLKPYDLVFTVDLEPTCTEPGHRTGVCSDGCGYTEEETIEPLGHTFGEWIPQGLTGEYRICQRCGQVETQTVPASEVIDKKIKEVTDPTNISKLMLISAGALAAVFIIVFLIIMISHSKRRTQNTKKKIK